MIRKFEVGDVVFLKSGSPWMTVQETEQDGRGGQMVRVQWFDVVGDELYGSHVHVTSFDSRMLAHEDEAED